MYAEIFYHRRANNVSDQRRSSGQNLAILVKFVGDRERERENKLNNANVERPRRDGALMDPYVTGMIIHSELMTLCALHSFEKIKRMLFRTLSGHAVLLLLPSRQHLKCITIIIISGNLHTFPLWNGRPSLAIGALVHSSSIWYDATITVNVIKDKQRMLH